MSPIPVNNTPSRQCGMTLIELMVAMTISLAMVAALTVLLANNSKTHKDLDRTSRQTENGRYAVELLSDDVQLAGYYGELPSSGANGQFVSADPCATALAALGFSNAPGAITAPYAIQGYAGTVTDPAPVCATDHKTDTAVVVVRRLATDVTALADLAAGNGYVQTSRCDTDPVMTPFIFSDTDADFILRAHGCVNIMEIRRYVTRMYYVADCDVCGQDSIPTLKRVELLDGALVTTPLAEGVEDMQLEYGFDTNHDGAPDVYRTGLNGVAGSPENDWSNVLAARVVLLSRTTDETPGYVDQKIYHLGLAGDRGPYNDSFKRRAFVQLARLINPSGWRE